MQVTSRNKFLKIMCLTLMVLVLTVSAFPANSESVQNRVWSGEYGERINMFAGDQSFSSDTPTYLIHGFGFITDDQKIIQPADFQLFIDGQSVHLLRFTNVYKDCSVAQNNNCNVFGEFWYVTFEAGYFSPGEYQFHGIWTLKIGVIIDFSITVSVT